MARKPQPEKQPDQASPGGLAAWLAILTLTGLTIADFADNGEIGSNLLLALIVLVSGFGGKVAEDVLRDWARRWRQ